MVILENIDIHIHKAILQNIDIDKISNRARVNRGYRTEGGEEGKGVREEGGEEKRRRRRRRKIVADGMIS